MRKLAILSAALALVAVSFYGCDETRITGPLAADTTGDELPNFSPAGPRGLVAYVAAGDAIRAFSVDDRREIASSQPLRPRSLVVSPNGQMLYAVDLFATPYLVDDLVVFEASSLTEVKRRTGFGKQNQDLGISPDGSFLYVARVVSNVMPVQSELTVVNTSDLTTVRGFGFSGRPYRLAVSPAGFIYVTVQSTSVSPARVLVIHPSSGIVAQIPVPGAYLLPVAFSPSGDYAYVGEYAKNAIYVIDTRIHTIIATVENIARVRKKYQPGIEPGAPVDIAFSADGHRAYVATDHGGTVVIVETAGHTKVKEKRVGSQVRSVAAAPLGSVVWVADFAGFAIAILDGKSKKGHLKLDSQPLSVVVASTPAGN